MALLMMIYMEIETMTLHTYEFTAPSAWASYLINGDASGLEDEDIEACDKWVSWVDMGSPVDCEDAGFKWYHSAHEFMPLGADCQTYTFLRERP